MVNMQNIEIEISGPYYQFSNRFGNNPSLHRDEWFISRVLNPDEEASEIETLLGIAPESCWDV